MSGIVGSKINIRGSGRIAKLGTDGQVLTSSGAGKPANYEDGATTYDDDQIQSNIAMLGFYVAVNGSLVRYNLVDQSIDEYYDTSGVDASASINEQRVASGSNFYYDGETTASPTVTEDADTTTVDGDYTWYRWTTVAAGSYSNDTTQDHIWLVVAGGGGGAGGAAGGDSGAGAGAGGYRYGTTLSLTGGTTYTMTVGDGGAGASGSDVGSSGGASSIAGTGITTISSAGGGGGVRSSSTAGSGGSGGAGGYNGTSGAGNTPAITQYTAAGETTTVQGYAGGPNGAFNQGSGGGGASEIGNTGSSSGACGAGGDGSANDITGSSVTYAGGGGGGSFYAGISGGAGGAGGGGTGGNHQAAGTAGTDGLGGGGGSFGGQGAGTGTGGDGGSGVVIVRRLTSPTTGGGDLTLQSTDVTAVAEPSYGELVTLIENAEGTATLNTDIKGFVSCDSGVTFAEGVLADEGSWGTNKQILGFHDLDISSQTGTSMCYKITTHNQSAGSKETRIYATSIGWR